MGVRAFLRGGYKTLVEPTEILVGSEVIGTWYPVGQETAEETVRDTIAKVQSRGPDRISVETALERVGVTEAPPEMGVAFTQTVGGPPLKLQAQAEFLAERKAKQAKIDAALRKKT